jgi:hypothetical protein
MQLIEVSDLGVRSAMIRLRRRDSPLRFVLFPMIHVGAPSFYTEVARRLRTFDLVVAEGIRGPSAATRTITRAYRLYGARNRDGLTVQSIDYQSLGVPVLFPDLDANTFEASWNRLPLSLRLQLTALFSLGGLGLRLFGSRETVARHAEVDDLPSREDVEARADPRFGPLLEIVGDERDAPLLRALERIHDERHDEAIQVAVVYGAGHMGAVVHHLDRKFRYWAGDAEWLTVFER